MSGGVGDCSIARIGTNYPLDLVSILLNLGFAPHSAGRMSALCHKQSIAVAIIGAAMTGRSRSTRTGADSATGGCTYSCGFAGKALDAWTYRHGVELRFIEPGKPAGSFMGLRQFAATPSMGNKPRSKGL